MSILSPLHTLPLDVTVFFVNKLFRIALVSAFMLAHLFCTCAVGFAAPAHGGADAVNVDTDDDHACCDPKNDHHPGDAPVEKHHHDSNCSHCGDASVLSAPDSGSKLAAPDIVSFTVNSLLIDCWALAATTRFQACSRWLADPSPPPDLLRVKCSLQI